MLDKAAFTKNLPVTLVVFKVFIKNSEGKILFLKRSDYKNWNNFKWENPGGTLNINESIETFLEREVLEETGLTTKSEKLPFYSQHRMCVDFKDVPFITMFFLSELVDGEVKLSEEHMEYKWLTIKEALDLDLIPESREAAEYLLKTQVTTTPSGDIL
jgi:ADP-ribose pyrophosphatase YjhB (NUDIX family)